MRHNVSLALMLASLAPLAGCIGTEDPQAETPGATQAGDAQAQDPAAPAGPASGATASTRDGAGGTNGTSGAVEVVTPLSWDGRLGVGACVPFLPNACLVPVQTPSQTRFPVEAEGVPRRLSLTLTWSASTPLTQELGVGLVLVKSCGANCVEGEGVGDSAVGASPLALDVVGIPQPGEGEWLEVYVWQKRATPAPVYGWARGDQPFQIEGSLVSLA